MKAPQPKKGRTNAQGASEYKTIPFSSFLNRENKVPDGVQVISDNEFYGNQNDTFNYAEFAHSKRKLVDHEKKVKSSFKSNWINGKNPLIDEIAQAAGKGNLANVNVYFYAQSGKPLAIK